MADRQLSPVQKRKTELRSFLESHSKEIGEALPSWMTPERLFRVTFTATQKTPKLMECSNASIAKALLDAAQCGLEPDGYHGHLVPYKTTCQFIPDYKGLIQLAYACGVSVQAHAVHAKDEFKQVLGTEPSIFHVPCTDDDPGELVAAYAVAWFGNRTVHVVAQKRDVMKRKNASRSSGDRYSPWQTWEEEMWKKTAVKMLCKYLPRDPRLTAALQVDDQAEMAPALPAPARSAEMRGALDVSEDQELQEMLEG